MLHRMKAFLLVLFVFGIGVTKPLYATDRYYAIFFGVQDVLNHFVTAHTFGVFVRANSGEGPLEESRLDTRIISWLPASGVVCLFCPAEKGRNYPLDESLDEPTMDGRKITAWGPYEVKEELYTRAVTQVALLESGKVLYKAIDDSERREGTATNCEHAVSDVDTDNGLLFTGTAHGNRGTRMVVKHLQRWVVAGGPDKEWVFRRLGLTQYPIVRETLFSQ